MRTRTKMKNVASDCARRENVPRHIFFTKPLYKLYRSKIEPAKCNVYNKIMIPGSRGQKSSCKQACIGFLTFCPDIIIKYVSEEEGWDNMPSTYAHYIFGQQIRGRLSGYERKIIDKYPELFNIRSMKSNIKKLRIFINNFSLISA